MKKLSLLFTLNPILIPPMYILLNFLKIYSHILLLGMVLIMPLFQGIAQAKEQNAEVVSEVSLHVYLLIGGINMVGRGRDH